MKWTFERLKESSSKYAELRDWRRAEPSAYATASQQGLLNELTAHMYRRKVNANFWSREKILDTAKLYSTRSEWAKAEPTAYSKAHKMGLLEIACSHMHSVGSKWRRCVYVIRVKASKKRYVGLTYKLERRFRDHLSSNRFLKILKDQGEDAVRIRQLTPYVNADVASKLEAYVLFWYQSKGYEILNRTSAGGLGGVDIKWTKEAIHADALKYSSLAEWIAAKTGSYAAASAKGLLETASAHMDRKWEKKWSKQVIAEEAKKFNSFSEWKTHSPLSFVAATNHGWIKDAEVVGHLKKGVVYNRKWNIDAVLLDAKKYSTKSDWKRQSPSAYKAAVDQGVMHEATVHMTTPSRVSVWTKEEVLASARNFGYRFAWKSAAPTAYSTARRKGYLEEATAHMELRLDKFKWSSVEEIISDARKYQTKSSWQRQSVGAYEAAKRLGCFEEAVAHMEPVRRSWSIEAIFESAEKYSKISEWKKFEGSAYQAARRLSVLESVSRHMQKRNSWQSEKLVMADARKYLKKSQWAESSGSAYAAAKRYGWFEAATQHMIDED